MPTISSANPKGGSAKTTSAETAEQVGFKSRVPSSQAESPVRVAGRRTGRNAQINIKTTPAAIDELHQIASENGWGLGETLEYSIAALKVQLAEHD